ncbi:isoflavone reductase [Neohortaea acidophila]|uniref:Isoflavone reductase n=1 Tax=Neohortaea acidophila TaxID=245834 RepID=A0A6A6PFX4_9PEZI|nr:isoflavone reductase [Neohortaea acidophila]KAF2478845.1 isoflavone reductase [Neohortaea acidophila]
MTAAHKTQNILIFGATGLIGRHITNAILDNAASFAGRIAIFTSSNTLWTKSDEIDALKARGVEIIGGDITSADAVNEAYTGFDTVVSCVGRPVIQNQLLLIQLAERHPDVKRFFPSEYGTDIDYDASSASEKPHQQKLKVRAALARVSKLQYTYVVTGPYGDGDSVLYLAASGPENEARGTFDVKRKRAVLLGDGNGRISLTTMRDVGKLVVAALQHPEEARNRALRVNSFTATPKEILAEFERQTGGQPWSVAFTSLAQLEELEREAWAKSDPKAGGLTLRRIWTSGRTLYDARDNGLIGMEDGVETLESAVRQAIKVQTEVEDEE